MNFQALAKDYMFAVKIIKKYKNLQSYKEVTVYLESVQTLRRGCHLWCLVMGCLEIIL